MLAAVACGQCGKPFQVPEADVGTSATCPWCKASVRALPLAASAATTPSEVLSLDDVPALPNAIASATKRSFAGALKRGIVILLVMSLVFLVSFGAVRYGSGWVPSFGWVEFITPDNSCRAEMPAAVSIEEAYNPIPDFPMTRPGKKFTAKTWYSKVTTSVGWIDIDPEKVKNLRLEDITGGETARRKAELGATATASSTVRRHDREGVEVVYRTQDGTVIDRMIYVPEGPRPRLYVLSYASRNVTADAPAFLRFYNSFRIDGK